MQEKARQESAGKEPSSDRITMLAQGSLAMAAGVSDVGLVRRNNEDAIFVHHSAKLLLLADGMGGHQHGAQASHTTLDVISRRLNPDTLVQDLGEATIVLGLPMEVAGLCSLVQRAVDAANDEVYKSNFNQHLSKYSGTTVVGLFLLENGYLLFFHVGDSRLYRLRKGRLQALTTDHSMHAEWIAAGRPGLEPGKQAITRAIGPHEFVEPAVGWDKWRKNDIYLLCSDGLTDMVPEEDIKKDLAAKKQVESIAQELVEKAREAGGKDNVSVIVCRMEKPG
jgi:protein phosphatase